jgi:hypothetical protein
VIRPPGADRDVRPDRPRATDKWLTASVVADARAVIAAVFDEAERRYPPRQREWVMLVDGAPADIAIASGVSAWPELDL